MKHALFKTNKGEFIVELDDEKAPKSVANFLAYVAKGQYSNTIFHRVIDGFMIQGGGYEPGMKQKPTDSPITNEADNGLKNVKYTLAMARTNDPHSATAQFFINVNDNEFLNHSSPTPQGWGYAVFGRVTEGTEVIDAIRLEKTGNKGFNQDVPLQDVLIESVTDMEAASEQARTEELAKTQPIIEQAATIIPVFRVESAQYFVAPELLTPWEIKLQGIEPFLTSAYAVGETFSLLGISQTEELVASGMLDSTDAIDPALWLKTVYIKSPSGEIIKHDVENNPTSAFVYTIRNSYRNMSLDAKFDNVEWTDKDGGAHKLNFMMAGSVNLELADTVVHAGPVLDTAVDGFETGFVVLGYELNAKRVNHNRRPRNTKPLRGESSLIYYLDDAGFYDNSGKFARGNTIDTFKVDGADTSLELRIGDDANEVSGANHYYVFSGFNAETHPAALEEGYAGQRLMLHLLFQNGVVPQVGQNGVTLEAVLAACGHRLEGFQSGKFACDDNQEALDHINAAIEALQRRTRARIARGVEGSHTA